jgi:hydrogenase maturation protease
MNVLVLGVGNILLSDEAIGVRVIEALEKKYAFSGQVEIVDGGTAGMELLEFIADRDHVIIVDAVLTGGEPGDVTLLRDNQVPTFFNNKVSPHQLGLSDLLSALKFTGESPKALTLVGVVPQSVEPFVGLTPLITDKSSQLQTMVIDELTRIGIQVTEKPVCA